MKLQITVVKLIMRDININLVVYFQLLYDCICFVFYTGILKLLAVLILGTMALLL